MTQAARPLTDDQSSLVPYEIPRLAALPEVQSALRWFRDQEAEFARWQMDLARIPAPPFGESARAAWVGEQFRALGIKEVSKDKIGNVCGFRKGRRDSIVSVSAHIDTVFPANTPLNIRQQGAKLYGPGISDNAAGVTALLAIAAAIENFNLPHEDSLLFIGNVGEEGEGDLRGMRYIFSESEWKDSIVSSLVLDGAGTDTIVTEALGSRRFEVIVRGPGGHSWSDFGALNPIVVLAGAIEAFSRVDVPNSPKTTFNVGVISGGTSVNSIPESASMRVDLRSSSAQEIDRLEDALRQTIARAVARAAQNGHAGEISHEIRLIGSRPAGEVPEQARIVQIARAVDQHLQNNSHLQRASTDANIPISLGIEAVALGAGGSGGGAHTLHEWYDPRGRDLGLKRVLLTALTLAGIS
jgi:tripeptide aminopeptidase